MVVTAPDNLNLNILTGFQNGLGMFNPWPTFDWNVMLFDNLDPLVSFFSLNSTPLDRWRGVAAA